MSSPWGTVFIQVLDYTGPLMLTPSGTPYTSSMITETKLGQDHQTLSYESSARLFGHPVFNPLQEGKLENNLLFEVIHLMPQPTVR
jgi:hypothetical protein